MMWLFKIKAEAPSRRFARAITDRDGRTWLVSYYRNGVSDTGEVFREGKLDLVLNDDEQKRVIASVKLPGE